MILTDCRAVVPRTLQDLITMSAMFWGQFDGRERSTEFRSNQVPNSSRLRLPAPRPLIESRCSFAEAAS